MFLVFAVSTLGTSSGIQDQAFIDPGHVQSGEVDGLGESTSGDCLGKKIYNIMDVPYAT